MSVLILEGHGDPENIESYGDLVIKSREPGAGSREPGAGSREPGAIFMSAGARDAAPERNRAQPAA